MNVTDEMRVYKRNGSLQEVSFDKILQRIKKIGSEVTPPLSINYSQLAMKVIDQLYDKIHTYVIDELTAEQCASLSTKSFDYSTMANRIIVSNNHKVTSDSFYTAMGLLYNNRDVHGVHKPIIHLDIWDIIQHKYKMLEKMIDYERDYLFDYFGFKTLERSYLMRVNGKLVERPQHMWMRVALGIHGNDLSAVKETYDLMSQKFFTHATPTLYNAGTPHPQLSSCYLISMEDDSIDGIYNTLKECAQISKWAGGIGLHIHNIRATGTPIIGTNGVSNGIVPMLKVFNSTARYVDQGGGKRNGSFAIYLEPWHADVEMFLDLKKNHGDEELKARDLFYALWIPDLFMEKVKKDEDWYLFCPHKCPGLADCYGEEFNTLYNKYASEGLANKVVKARQLWFKILDSQMETGTPYLLYKDAANKKSNQKNLGTLKSSNLCVAPETMILTDNGYFEIKSLEGKQINVWNGEEFSETIVHKTGINQELITINTSDGCTLDCTPYHKFFVQNKYDKSSKKTNKHVETIEAQHLKVNDKLVKCEFPIIDGKNDIKYPYTHGFFCGDGTYNQNNRVEKTKCNNIAILNESYCKRHIDLNVDKNDNLLDKQTTNGSMKCHGMSYDKKPILALYGEKKDLLKYLDYRSVGNIDEMGRLNLCLPLDINNKFYVPLDASIKNKMEWFSGYCDADGCIARNGTNESLQISSIDKDFITKVKLMLQTCGINPKVTLLHNGCKRMLPDSNRILKEYTCKAIYRLLITSIDLHKLIDLGLSTKRLKIDITNKPNRDARHFVTITEIINSGRKDDTYCFNESKKHAGIFNGIITSQCSEIIEYSDGEETAVCNLASISLSKFVKEDKTFDYEHLHSVTKVVTTNLNKIIDINFYPTDKTRVSNLLHRPIGIGVQGLADAFALMDIAYHSEKAREVNKMIFETIYHASLERSNELAKERTFDMLFLKNYRENGFITKGSGKDNIFIANEVKNKAYLSGRNYIKQDDMIIDSLIKKVNPIPYEFSNLSDQHLGAYSSFTGSPASQGILQFDMWATNMTSASATAPSASATAPSASSIDSTEKKDPLYSINNDEPHHKKVKRERYDWSALKESIKQHGLRNSLLVAPMPTASTSQILGNNECFEPFTSNIYSRRTNAGEFVLVNKYLMNELNKLGLWNEDIKNNIILNKGSVQHIDCIPQYIKNKYKIVWEIPMKHMIDMAADRGAFICQSQSLNLWLEDPDYKTLTSMHFYSWEKGLKTGIYYLRRKAKHQAQQFTIVPEMKKGEKDDKDKKQDDGCEMCSA